MSKEQNAELNVLRKSFFHGKVTDLNEVLYNIIFLMQK